jgi:class 3 adenylate cyclase/tetratricopeptide (TPR) repeat protein
MTSKLISFGSFTLDLDRFCVLGPSGQVDLRRKSFEVLRYLLEHRGQVAGKKELLEAVWPNVTVGEDSLAQCISEIRRAIGDDQQRIIKTVPRRGYLAHLQLPPREPAQLAELVQPIAPERRQLTILVCNMLDGMALATRMDPEDFREVVAAVNSCIREVVKLHGGTVCEFARDGVVGYFGYPRAHEADAERAVRAGLALSRAIGELHVKALRAAPQVRTAVATGLVVVENENGKATGPTVVGEAPILASRLLQLASPGSVVISGGTRKLLGDLFRYRGLGDVESQGANEPVVGYQVLSESKITSRFEALRSRPRQLFGREEEVDLLWRRWEHAKRGEGRAVLITGEPGIGKSRLARALQERVRSEACTQLLYHCSPYHQDSALYPIIGQLIRAADIERDDPPQTKLDKLEALLRQSSGKLTEAMPLFAALLSIPGGDRYPVPTFPPQRIRTRTLGALLAHLKQLAANQPVLIVFEDVHWIDPTSLELLSLAIDQIKTARILMLATARPEFTPPWASHRHTSNIGLTRLDKIEAEALAAGVTGGKLLPRELLAEILGRSDGVPLFIEELTKMALDSGLLREADDCYELTGPLPALAIPSTLHASLLARLDRLTSAKDVAQIGAAIGREFTYALIAAVVLSERDLNTALAELTHAELLFQRGVPPDATYQFKHALVQDAAYASLVRSRRHHLHGLIARALVEKFPEVADIEPEIVAHHYAEAGVADAAIDYWQKAAERAIRTSAYAEAVNHITNGVDLLRQLPSTMSRMRQELRFQIALGGACIAFKGWTASETGAAYARAYELSQATKDPSQLPKILAGLFVHFHVRADVQQAQLAANELLAFARGRCDAAAEMMAHRALGDSLLHVGDFRGASTHLEEALSILGPQSQPVFVGEDVRTAALAFLSLCLAFQGHVSVAEERWQGAITRARSVQDPHTVAFALSVRCRTQCLLLDHNGLVQNLEPLHALAIEHNLKFVQVLVTTYGGWAMALEGRTAEAISLLQNGIEGLKSAGAQWHLLFHGPMLATAYRRTGRFEDGLSVIGSLFEVVERTGVRYMEAELYRVRAELLVSLSNLDDAEHALHRGLTVAREQQARIFEMRIATTLAKIWQDQGHSAKARELLKPICDAFGRLSLRDLENANEVLRTLNNRSSPTVVLR